MKTARFGSDGTTTPSVFMVNEAEAAAMHVLNSENFVLNVSELFSQIQIAVVDRFT
jgi:hypothetical protein